jgi:membrane-associated phospholipid phosphatase
MRRLAWILTPIILTLTVATVWGRFHYFTDVLVGLPIGLGAVYLADYCWRTHWSWNLGRNRQGKTAAIATVKTMGQTEEQGV